MADIQNQFIDFHDSIKLGRYDENQTLRDKRDIIKTKLENGIKKFFEDQGLDVPSINFFDQGSYAIDTGIKPKDGDYDIDEGIILGLNKEDYSDPIYFKTMVRDIMKNHTKKEAKIKNPCVTITYTKGEDPQYHVDLPIYLKSNEDENLYLAWGKEFSSTENKKWEISDPKGLNEYIREAFTGDDKKQFKRIVRYLKKWKDIKFSSESSDGTPPSVGITVIAAEKFQPVKEKNNTTGIEKYNDLKAIKLMVDSIIGLFKDEYDFETNKSLKVIEFNLSVENKSNVFSKMTPNKMNLFYEKIIKLQAALQITIDETDPHNACKELAKYFGNDFPIPESIQNRYKTVGVSSAPASNFA